MYYKRVNASDKRNSQMILDHMNPHLSKNYLVQADTKMLETFWSILIISLAIVILVQFINTHCIN